MDQRELLLSCRRGDLDRIRYLVEEKEVDLNVRDIWDSTPLYYACLCGHYEVVKYLLEQGAKCEANTFDGERCLYGALNAEIKNLLRTYKVVSSQIIRRELYQEFLRKVLETGEYADVRFIVHGREFLAHKCILATRSEYFFEQFVGRWRNRSVVYIKREQVNPAAFDAMLRYIYTGRLEIHIEGIDDLILLVRFCKLNGLLELIDSTVKKTHVIECSKPGIHVTTLVIEAPPDSIEMQTDFGVMAEEALPKEMCTWVGPNELPFFHEERAPFADVIFEVENNRFLCHKVFFCCRSEYFKAIMRDPFHEQLDSDDEESTSLPIFKLHTLTTSVFVSILYYIYQDMVRFDTESVLDVLLAADLCLLPGLKRQCGAFMAQYLDTLNVCSVLQTARLFALPRLEDQCYQFLAENLEKMVNSEAFHEIILQDATAVVEREDVDSIDIIDNMRFHLTASSIDEAHDKLELIDDLLERLNLIA